MGKKEKNHLKQLKEIHNLIFLSKLASGSSSVYSLWAYQTRQSVAIKIKKNTKESEFSTSHWIKCNHPHLIPLLRVIDFKDDYVGYVMPLAEYPIRKVISTYSNNSGSYEQAKFWIYQLLTGICYLHDQKLCHLNINVDNVLIDKGQNAILAGFSKIRYEGETYDLEEKDSIYLPPEWRSKREFDNFSGQKMDMWCFGITALAILLGKEFEKMVYSWKDIVIFSKDRVKLLTTKIADKEYFEKIVKKAHPCSSITSINAENANSFFNQLLKEEARGRCASQDVLCHSLLWPNNKFQVGAVDKSMPKIHQDDGLHEHLYSLPNEKSVFSIRKELSSKGGSI
ncbi:uncharacterized protein [Centruroides vittatus]|uniref:uncharacterized protein n=1 Tax=Centruroides vittatus TaxID=120091 RepID=UPI00350E9F63